LVENAIVTLEEVQNWQDEYLNAIKTELSSISSQKKPAISTLFEDIHQVKDKNSLEQEESLKAHLKKYGQH